MKLLQLGWARVKSRNIKGTERSRARHQPAPMECISIESSRGNGVVVKGFKRPIDGRAKSGAAVLSSQFFCNAM